MIALHERNFRLYWLGQAISNIGNWTQIVALGWLVLQINGSPLALGLLGLAQSLPLFTLSLVGGVLADRFPRLKLLLITQSLAMLLAFALALLAATGKPPLWSLLLIAALAAGVTAIDNPARQAFLSDLVSKDILLNAVALNASVYNGAAVIGPSLAGLALLSIGAATCFLLNAISFLAVLAALLVIARTQTRQTKPPVEVRLIAPLKQNAETTPAGHNTNEPWSFQRTFMQDKLGFRSFGTLRHEHGILAILGVAAATSLLGRPYLLLMPAFARIVQHVGPSGLGIMVASSGLGSLIGSLLLASLKTSKRLHGLLVICGASFSVALILFVLMRSFLLASLSLVGCGAGATMTMTVANTLLQTSAPTNMRGRVMSLYTLIAAGLTPLGTLLVSGLGTSIGLGEATIVAALGVMVVAIGYRLLKQKA